MHSIVTNGISLTLLLLGMVFSEPHLQYTGAYAFSGAITNWLAIHMLFEKVPLLYGSGVIPRRFEAFKSAIKRLIMEQFFTQDNLTTFFDQHTEKLTAHHITPILDAIDYDLVFNALIDACMQSSLGAMISMVGGPALFDEVKPDFIRTFKQALTKMTEQPAFCQAIANQGGLLQPERIIRNIEAIIDQRLTTLTPLMVKTLVQALIKAHLGWLVVWGGVLGGLMGFMMSLIPHLWY